MKQFLRRFRIPLIVVGILCLLLTTALITYRAYAMRNAAEQDGNGQPAQTDTQEDTEKTETPEASENPKVDVTKAVSIVFSDNSVQTTASEDDVKVEGTDVTIRAGGTYFLSGSCGNGSVKVKKETQGVVLVLDSLALTAEGTAPIRCNQGTEVTIMAAEGSVNTLADTETNNDETAPNNENAENAVIKCKDGSRVLLCGTGTLNIQGTGKNGIKGGAATDEAGTANLSISELTLNVTAADDGIKSDSDLTFYSGAITVSAGDDAISSDSSVTVGAADAEGPTLTVSDCTEGIEAPQVNILSGNVDIHAQDDGLNAVSETGTADITIAGGTVLIDAEGGDGLDSNGTVNITGGDIRVFSSSRSDNSPLDYGTDMSITGGTVLAIGSSGMAQAPNLTAQTYVVFSAGNRIGGPQGGFGAEAAADSISFTLRQGDKVQILDENGKTLAEAEAARQADYVYYSSPSLTDGQNCILNVNGQSVGTAAATSELSAVGGIPDMGGGTGNMPNGGNFDPGNMPQKPDGDFDSDNMPQMPDGGNFDPGNMPQMPDGGNFDPGNMPQMPGGDFDPDNMPQMPDGNFDPGNMPQRPDGGQGSGRPGQGSPNTQNGGASEEGNGKNA